MKTNRLSAMIMILFILALLPHGARADVLVAEPMATAALSAEVSPASAVVLKFDLSGMREGPGREIDEALLDWPLGDLAVERAEFTMYEVTGTWDATSVATGASVSRAEPPGAAWELEPLDLERLGGFVRLDLKPLVVKWLADPGTNHGVVVSTSDLDRDVLVRALGDARLIIRYGFSGAK